MVIVGFLGIPVQSTFDDTFVDFECLERDKDAFISSLDAKSIRFTIA